MTAKLTEAQFQTQVENLAVFYGWRVYHTHDSRRSQPGFPDLVLVRGAELLFAELKTDTGRVKPEQQAWIDALAIVEDHVADLAAEAGASASIAVEVRLWRPADFHVLHERLARGRHRIEPIYREAA